MPSRQPRRKPATYPRRSSASEPVELPTIPEAETPPTPIPTSSNPADIDRRLFELANTLLGRLQEKTDAVLSGTKLDTKLVRELTNTMVTVARIRSLYAGINVKERREDENAGAQVRRYGAAFQANAARGRAFGPGPSPFTGDDNGRDEPEPDWRAERDADGWELPSDG